MINFDNVSKIAYLGPSASFSEMAHDIFCGKYNIKAYPEPQNTIKQVIEFVQNNPDSLGVLPVENSIEGTVRETLDNLIRCPNPNIKILSEIVLPIHHCLLSKTTEFYSITGIISHPQALAQCQEFIHNELPRNLNIIEAPSTAEAAKSLANYNLTYAAIGSEKTAEIYNLNILRENINDDKSNQTMFILVGDFETEPTGNDRTTLMFSAANKPGALMEILNIFYQNNINLSHISSRPSKHEFGDYIFIVTFDGHVKNKRIFETIRQVKEKATYVKFMGSYEK